jgi:NAD(P)-dependent dehydrogenase (short-subunit alcohol dehydrogenase family)
VVVGGGAGWGRAISKRLASDGAEVLVVDANPTHVAETCDEIAAGGGRCERFVCPIDDARALNELASQWLDRGRTIDALVTCYMDLDWTSIEDCEIADFERVVLFNLVGPVKATKAWLPLLRRAAGASILHVGSVDGLLGSPRVPSYSASKGGLVPLTHVMAYEFAKYDIRVNAIASAQTVQLPRTQDVASSSIGYRGFPGSDYMAQLNEATPLKRYGPLTDWAGAAAFLVSDDAAYVTGSVLVVDCGRTAITAGTA